MHRVRDESVMKAFGTHVRELRKSNGFTQESLAHKADIAFSSVARIEAGQLNTSISTIVRLASALGVDKSELLKF
ncbi:MAG: helix-turn-helix transcriptional regulator [Reichenbachiella sp.]|uniref:helix-turn-helix domain-containing protein n=1 Tax=Reichenbachiella sp. TaxID=2184521 RepID=UPI00329A34D4